MYTLAIVADTQNHKFFSAFYKRNCTQLHIVEISLNSILEQNLNRNFFKRLKIASNIKRWVIENNSYDGVLIFSDYNYAYRTIVHYCKRYDKPIFLYQDGFIFFEPWPKTLSGILKTAIYLSFKLLGFSHLISYQSFHSTPTLVFSWGDHFSRTFEQITQAKIVTLGCLMYEKAFRMSPTEKPLSDVILYYATFYRDKAKDKMAKIEAVNNLKVLLQNENTFTCEVKFHPLDKNRLYFEQLLRSHFISAKINILENTFQLSKNMAKYKFIISELSSETIFASMFCSNIFFFKDHLNEKHFAALKDFLKSQKIGVNEYYRIDQNLIGDFKSQYFQTFNVERFEQVIQKYY